MTVSVTSRWIEIPAGGDSFQGYLALPKTGSGPAVIILQEIFGVNSHIRSVADREKATELLQKTKVEEAGSPMSVPPRRHCVRCRKCRARLRRSVIASVVIWRILPRRKVQSMWTVDVAYYGGGIQNALDKAGQINAPMQSIANSTRTSPWTPSMPCVKSSRAARSRKCTCTRKPTTASTAAAGARRSM